MVKRLVVAIFILVVCVILGLWGYYMFFFGFGNKSFTYKYDENVFTNPLMGYAPDGRNVDLCEEASLVYAYVTWAELEPSEGVYDWNGFIKKFNLGRWKADGKHLVFRFVCDYPSSEKHMDIPEWLYVKTGDGEFYDIEYGSGYCPEYNNEVFIEKHEAVIAEIGRFFREDFTDFLAYVELGSLGHWGEWHTYYPAGLPQIPLTYVRESYVSAYEKSFPDVKILMRRPFAERPLNAGVYNDMTGDVNDTGVWLSWIEKGGRYEATGEEKGIVAAPSIWKLAPVGGEFTSGTPMSVMLGSAYSSTEDLLKKSHMTFIGPKVPDTREFPELKEPAEKLLKSVGYRYMISSLKITKGDIAGNYDLTMTVENRGTAPIYYDWKLNLYVDAPEKEAMDKYAVNVDLRKLCEGDSTECSVSLPASVFNTGGAKIYAGIENPATGKPEVYLAMKAERNGSLSLLYER